MGVVGSCNVDLVVHCATLPRPGETVIGGDVVRLPGGKGANQAVAAARMGARVSLMASLGTDESGDWLLANLVAQGVDVSLMRRGDRATGMALITVDQFGDNEIVVAPGANAEVDVSDIALEEFDVVLAQLEVPASVVRDAAGRSREFILNVAPAVALDAATLARCSVVIANEVEAASYDFANLNHVIVTLGPRGAVHYCRGREVTRAFAPAIEAVDTVGAGDVFCGAYAVEYARGTPAPEALRFAVTAGSLATLAVGAQGARPTREEVAQWLALA